jgi:hypothetical protein
LLHPRARACSAGSRLLASSWSGRSSAWWVRGSCVAAAGGSASSWPTTATARHSQRWFMHRSSRAASAPKLRCTAAPSRNAALLLSKKVSRRYRPISSATSRPLLSRGQLQQVAGEGGAVHRSPSDRGERRGIAPGSQGRGSGRGLDAVDTGRRPLAFGGTKRPRRRQPRGRAEGLGDHAWPGPGRERTARNSLQASHEI